jgi:hypothetical protein
MFIAFKFVGQSCLPIRMMKKIYYAKSNIEILFTASFRQSFILLKYLG